MVKPAKNQWDFGELFSEKATRKVWPVTELTTQIRRMLERQYADIWVSGEVSSLHAHSSGHIYFTLKDSGAQLSCVLFRGEAPSERSLLREGQQVLLKGTLTVYEARGQYQLRVTAIELQGVGALQLAFEKLKRKLQAEGLFLQEHKRPIPRFPTRIGLVTSPTGAAIQDVIHVIGRRNPSLELVLAPCRVQGAGSSTEIAAAIRDLNEWACGLQSRWEANGNGKWLPVSPVLPSKLDIILVTRGGGSIEDLWAFNEEETARAIHDSHVPVISAVGHEIDFTISDFVADLWAATPSAAAEIITEAAFGSKQFLLSTCQRLPRLAQGRLELEKERVSDLQHRLNRVHPLRNLNEQWQRLDDLQGSLVQWIRIRKQNISLRLQANQQRLNRIRPAHLIEQERVKQNNLLRQLTYQFHARLDGLSNQSGSLMKRLHILSPVNVLARGYSITTTAQSGSIVRSMNQVEKGSAIRTQVKDGAFISHID